MPCSADQIIRPTEEEATPVLGQDNVAQAGNADTASASLCSVCNAADEIFVHVGGRGPRMEPLCLLAPVPEVVEFRGHIPQPLPSVGGSIAQCSVSSEQQVNVTMEPCQRLPTQEEPRLPAGLIDPDRCLE